MGKTQGSKASSRKLAATANHGSPGKQWMMRSVKSTKEMFLQAMLLRIDSHVDNLLYNVAPTQHMRLFITVIGYQIHRPGPDPRNAVSPTCNNGGFSPSFGHLLLFRLKRMYESNESDVAEPWKITEMIIDGGSMSSQTPTDYFVLLMLICSLPGTKRIGSCSSDLVQPCRLIESHKVLRLYLRRVWQ